MPSERPCALAIDAGGTYFKSALVAADGRLIGAPRSTPVDSNGPADSIMASYGDIIDDAWAVATQKGLGLVGIGVSTPGPFDYAISTSLMTHKFPHLRGINLADALRERHASLREIPIRFVQDAHAFIAGEQWQGAAQGWNRVAGVTLGTGIGFGVMIDGRIHDNGSGGPFVILYARPCRGGILEDVVSRRGILRLYRERRKAGGLATADTLDVADMAHRAMQAGQPDGDAIATFHEVGTVLGEHLRAVAASLRLECLVFGGQIAKSFALLEPALRLALKGEVQLRVSESIDDSALIGAAKSFFSAQPVQSQRSFS